MQQNDTDLFSNKSGLEALQAAMSSGSFNLPLPFPGAGAFLSPSQPVTQPHSVTSLLSSQSSSHNNNNVSSSVNNNSANNARISSASSHSSESSQGSGRHGIDNSNRDSVGPSANSSSGSQNIGNQQQPNWSFEEQFKQVRQASITFFLFAFAFYYPIS